MIRSEMNSNPTIGIAMDFVLPEVIEGAGAYGRQHGLRIDARWSVRADWIPGNPGWDGILANLLGEKEIRKKVEALGLPIVHVGGDQTALPRVDIDYALCAKLAVEEFQKLGLSRIASMAWGKAPVPLRSYRAMRVECRRAGLEFIPLPFQPKGSWLEALPALAKELAAIDPPVGLFFPHASVVFSLLDELAKYSVHVPHDVAIIVVEKGVQQTAKLAPIPLTAVTLDRWQQGYDAAQLLHQMIQGKPPPTPIQRIPPAGLVRRQSTGVAGGRDPVVAKALHLISEGPPEGVEINGLAQLTGTSRRALELRFKKETGTTLHRAIINQRIAEAKRLLGTGKSSVADVSQQCAFSSVQYFTAAFKRETGETPGNYRKRHS